MDNSNKLITIALVGTAAYLFYRNFSNKAEDNASLKEAIEQKPFLAYSTLSPNNVLIYNRSGISQTKPNVTYKIPEQDILGLPRFEQDLLKGGFVKTQQFVQGIRQPIARFLGSIF